MQYLQEWTEKWENAETKENSPTRLNNNSLVIKQSQGPLIPPLLFEMFASWNEENTHEMFAYDAKLKPEIDLKSVPKGL